MPQAKISPNRPQAPVLTSRKAGDNAEDAENIQIAQHKVDVEKGIVLVRFGKKLSFPDIRRYAESLRANRSFLPTFSEIVDLTEVEEFDLVADDFLKLADQTDPFSRDAKRAFVVRNSTQNHAARMHKLLRGEKHFAIFPTVQEAEHWIRG